MSTLPSLFPPSSGRVGRMNMTSAQAVVRGLRGKCPNCGRGRLFSGFLKVAERCDVCGEELFHQRADDFPPYLVIFLVGHTVVPLALAVETEYSPPMWLQVAVWSLVTVGLALALIQPVKGAVIAIQWYGRMHGFGRDPPGRSARGLSLCRAQPGWSGAQSGEGDPGQSRDGFRNHFRTE